MKEPNRLGKYEVVGTLGKGAMGVVYKAVDPVIERAVAIKTIRKDLGDDSLESVGARFRNEARAAGRLNHPGIVQVYEYGEDGDVAFIAMEYVDGLALRHYLTNRARFPAPDVVSVMGQLLDALGYAHQHGVVHRDVKPANIMLMTNGRLKITDFGIARVDASVLTMVGAVSGTPSYMSPEQFTGKPSDARADLFAAGVVFYELITGVKPFAGSPEAVAYNICYTKHVPPSSHDAGLPEGVDRLVDRALAKDPAERYQNAAQFRDDIEATYRSGPRAAVSEETIRAFTIANPMMHGEAVPRSATTGSSGGTHTAPPQGWNEDTLHAIELQLARYMGPLARVLVKKAAQRAASVDELYQLLADYVQSPAERTSFLSTSGRTMLTMTARSVQAVTAGAGTDPAAHSQPTVTERDVEAATGLLVPYLGPIARVLAKRTALKSAGLRAYYIELAGAVKPEDRARFLSAAGYPDA